MREYNWYLRVGITAFSIVVGLIFFVKNTAAKYFLVEDDRLGSNSQSCNSSSAVDAGVSPSQAMPGLFPTSDSCVVCDRLTKKQCSRCKVVRYCSESCQKSHWRSGHKDKCKEFWLSCRSSLQGRRNSTAVTGNSTQIKKILFPYEKFVELFNWNSQCFPPCGLLNCGNSCFANVVHQCLAYTRPLAAYLLEKGHRREYMSSDSDIEADVVDHIAEHPWLQFEAGSIEHAKCSKFIRMKIGHQKAVDWEVMAELGERDRLAAIIGDDTPWRRLFEIAFLPSYRELTVEFLSTFTYIRLDEMEEHDERSEISFMLCGHANQMSIEQFAVVSGLYYEPETVTPLFTEGITEMEEGRLREWWPQIAGGSFQRTKGRVTGIRDPLIRYLHRMIATSITGRGKSREWCTIPDLFYLYCLITGTRCNLARCLAEYFASYYHRQERGAVYGGAYITLIARSLAYLPRHLGDVSPPIEPVRLDRRTLFGMRIIRQFPVGIRFSLRPGEIWQSAPVQQLDIADAQQQHGQPHDQPPPDEQPHDQPPPQPQFPRHIYRDVRLPARMETFMQDISRSLRQQSRRLDRVEDLMEWHV